MSTTVSPRPSAATVHPTRQQLDELDALLQRMLDLPVNGAAEEAAELVRPKPERTAKETMRPSSSPVEDSRSEPSVPPLPSRDESEPAAVREDGEDTEGWVPLRSSWQPSAQTWGPLARQWQEAQQAGQAAPNTSKQKDSPEEPRADIEQEQTALRTEPTPEPNERPIAPEDELEPAEKTELREDATQTVAPPRFEGPPTTWQMDAHAAQEALPPLPSLKDILPPLAGPATAEKQAESASSDIEAPLPFWLWPFSAITVGFDGCLALFGPVGKPLRSKTGKNVLGTIGLLCLTVAGLLASIDWFGWTW